MIVVDSNVLAYYILPGTHTATAERWRRRDRHWIAPELILHEWLNVIVLNVKKRVLDRDQALRAFRRGCDVVRVDRTELNPAAILHIHNRTRCTSYDCQFIHLAERLNVPLVTADKEVLEAFPAQALALESAP